MKPYVIGVAGGSSSGKTTLVRALAEALGGHVPVFCHDNYYRDRRDLTFEQRCRINYDEPAALETELLIAHLDALLAGKPAAQPTYDFANHLRGAETVAIAPAPVIIVEGILIFCDPDLRERMDLRVFVDADATARLARRIARDVAQRGRTAGSVRAQFDATVEPMHEKYVEPSRVFAHLTVSGCGDTKKAVEKILGDPHVGAFLAALRCQ